MRCPTCIKLGLPAIYFCGKECFTKAWPTHKLLHTLLTSSGPCTLPPPSPPPPLVVLTRHFFGRVRSSFLLAGAATNISFSHSSTSAADGTRCPSPNGSRSQLVHL
jgi:hypothetical protein